MEGRGEEEIGERKDGIIIASVLRSFYAVDALAMLDFMISRASSTLT